MSICKRCGEEIPENGIHLFRNWVGRKEGVEKAFPDAKVSFCKNPPLPSFFEEKVKT